MRTIRRIWQPLALAFLISLAIGMWLTPAQASSALNESRIRQLEFQVRSLQTQISQIQSRTPGSPASPAAPSPAADIFNEPTPQEQFDNLATLVIEINQRVQAIEQQLAD
ncbi:MAG: hypothetical protein AAF716_09745 [Cyanobacteria bacterium P01_D01_bin.1]